MTCLFLQAGCNFRNNTQQTSLFLFVDYKQAILFHCPYVLGRTSVKCVLTVLETFKWLPSRKSSGPVQNDIYQKKLKLFCYLFIYCPFCSTPTHPSCRKIYSTSRSELMRMFFFPHTFLFTCSVAQRLRNLLCHIPMDTRSILYIQLGVGFGGKNTAAVLHQKPLCYPQFQP